MKDIKLFDYQQEMLEDIVKAFSTAAFDSVFYDEKGERVNVGSSVMVQMPTGTGKTYVMAAVVRWFLDAFSEGEVWLIAHRKELVRQVERTLDRFSMAYCEKEEESTAKARIRVLSIQWLTRNIDDLEKKGFVPGLIIVDEAHHALATSYQDVFVRNPGALRIGMTATPCRMRQASFGTLFSRLLTSLAARDFILRGYLAPYDYVVVGEKSADQQIVNLLKARASDGDYALKELNEKLNTLEAIQRLYNSVMKYAVGKRGIVYAINIDHAKAIADYYNALGIKAVALDSKTAAKTRKKMVEAFRDGELDCLVSVNLFDEGFDCPDVGYVQMARPTLSLARYLQMAERGLRINRDAPGKACVIIDNVGNYRKFGLPDRFRNWDAMFEGLMPGKGMVMSCVQNVDGVVDDEMVMVNKAEMGRKPMTAEELRSFWENIMPFREENGMRMGLKSGDEVVLPPSYSYISNFKGNYAVFHPDSANLLAGIIDRYGNVIVPAEYRGFRFLNHYSVLAIKDDGSTETIML